METLPRGDREKSQHNVEQVIGRLVTDEAFRRRFAANPRSVLAELVARRVDLNAHG